MRGGNRRLAAKHRPIGPLETPAAAEFPPRTAGAGLEMGNRRRACVGDGLRTMVRARSVRRRRVARGVAAVVGKVACFRNARATERGSANSACGEPRADYE